MAYTCKVCDPTACIVHILFHCFMANDDCRGTVYICKYFSCGYNPLLFFVDGCAYALKRSHHPVAGSADE